MIDKLKVEELLKVREDGILKHRESQTLEFKTSFNFAGLAEYFRDFAGFANNRGGYLIFGVIDRPRRILNGLSESSFNQFDKLDPEKITGYLLEYFSGNIEWEHDVFELGGKKFGVFKVEKSLSKPIICKKSIKDIIKDGEIYFRYGGRTQVILHSELEAIINDRIKANTANWMDLIQKIAEAGPQNAAILDASSGKISKKDSQILVIDENLIDKIKFIREGHFSEKEGATTLKLVGDVSPMEKVEVTKVEKTNRLREYPLSARQLAYKLKSTYGIKEKDVWRIINQNQIKSDPNYSIYNFRNREQEIEYENSKKVPKGTPSIYKPSTIDYIVQIYRNESH